MINLKELKKRIIGNRWLIGVIILHFILNLFNITQSPAIFVDEHLYTIRGWSFSEFSYIGMYPWDYDYDHPFLGWIIYGLLAKIMPGTYWIERTRYATIFSSTISIVAIYLIIQKIHSKSNAVIISFFVSISNILIPLSRMVLIDNIATTFLLLSINMLIETKGNGFKVILTPTSAILMGLASLCKITYLIFLPGILLAFFLTNRKILEFKHGEEHINQNNFKFFGRFRVIIKTFSNPLRFCLIIGSIFAFWPLYAIIEGDWQISPYFGFFPKFIQQLSRGNIPFWQENSYFLETLNYIWEINPIFTIIFFIIPISNILLQLHEIHEFKFKGTIFYCLISSFYFLFLIRGGVTYFFYLIPLIYLFFIALSDIVHYILEKFYKFHQGILLKPKKKTTNKFGNLQQFKFVVIIMIFIGILAYPFNMVNIVDRENDLPYELNGWVKANLEEESVIATDCLFIPDLYEEGFHTIFLYWKLNSYEPTINNTVLHGDWHNIDYFIINQNTYDILHSAPYENEGVLLTALENSEIIQAFGEIYIWKVINE